MKDLNKIDYNKDELINARLGAIVSNSEDAIISKDLNGIITTWNRAAERMFGYTEEEAVGQSITLIFPEERIEEEKEILGKLRSGKRIAHYETVRLHKDGTPINVSLSISPIKDEAGNIVGVSKIARDITEQKRAEEALRESEEKHRALFESMDEGYCIIEVIFDENRNVTDYRFKEVNPAFYEHTGLKNVEGRTAREVAPATEDHWFEIYGKVVRTGEPVRFEQPAKAIGRILEVYAYPFDKLKPHKIAVLFKDITERKRNQQKLKEMNETLEEKVKERTASLISYQEQLRLLASELSKAKEQERQRLATDLHDNMGQLLAVGKMKLEALGRKAQSEEVEDEVDELKHLMDQAITYSRKLVTDLKPPPTLNSKNIGEHISWIAEKMKEYQLHVSIRDEGNITELDEEVRSTILQCVRELLFNVVKHAGVDRAQIILKRKDDLVEIQVIDKGSGFDLAGEIPPGDSQNGFGLFSIKERLKIIGGTVNIVTRPGEGTHVTIMVPLDSDEYAEPSEFVRQEALSPQFRKGEGEPKSKIGVLIADDHQLMREGLCKLIEGEEDMEVVAEASDGQEALGMADEFHPEVVVMDVNMPEINGIVATKKILDRNPNICVIGLSFHKEERVVNAMYEAGASAYLTKSDVFETLCATIRNQVNGTDTQTEEQ